MIDSLMSLGIGIEQLNGGSRLAVTGCGGRIPETRADLYAANSGTTMRFLTAMAALGNGAYRLDGIARMRKRPIADLLDSLGQLGAETYCEHDNGCPPVIVRGRGLDGGTARIRGNVSSQFLSGLLMMAPHARRDVHVQLVGPLVSQPYVLLTLAVMRAFGVSVSLANGLSEYWVRAPQSYRGCHYQIEPDASAASYFWAAAAITKGMMTVEGLSVDSLQGEVAFCDCLQRMGCRVEYGANAITVTGNHLEGIEVDLGAISDTVQTLAAVALFAETPTTIRGVAHIRHKKTDRIGCLVRELRKLGATVEQLEDGLRIVPGPLRGAEVDTYKDPRMAMSLALVGLRVPDVVVRDPSCTENTYPRFFEELVALGD
jgi:3-phosphoshikimate 1-carboxyvinyltransferase